MKGTKATVRTSGFWLRRCAPEVCRGMERSLAGRSDKSRFSECEVPMGLTRGVVRVKVQTGPDLCPRKLTGCLSGAVPCLPYDGSSASVQGDPARAPRGQGTPGGGCEMRSLHGGV